MAEKAEDFYVVGVGASAGGLEALNSFFDNVSPNSGLAFVVVQHLSPSHESHMVDLLSKRTLMEVKQVEDGMQIEANKIYLIPPNNNMTIFHRQLFLSDRDEDQLHPNLPIDVFFRSLAEDCADKAIGIILSGTGSDGTRGIRAIKEENGMVMVQNEKSAKFSGMPSNAIATGVVDYILQPEMMGEKLLQYIKHPYVSNDNETDASEKTEEVDTDGFSRILSILKEEENVDFTYYKDNTIRRRIERRMIINQAENLEDYIEFLRSSPREAKTLHKELLIGVTEFFRDEKAFDVIKKEVIPEIIEQKEENEEIRIWVAGCSTGEEAYSLAILFREYLRENRLNRVVKIFATDIGEDALRQASKGEFPVSIIADIEPELLERYFVKSGEVYRVNKGIREMVVFSQHNLTKDPPFYRIDFISCRNLLIYFQPVLQKKVLSFFHFSLNQGGFLFLGNSETVGDMIDFFQTFNSRWKIYKCTGKDKKEIQKEVLNNFRPSYDREIDGFTPGMDQNLVMVKDEKIRDNRIKKELITRYVPDSAIIDEDNQIVHIIGNLNKFLQLPVNMVSLNILNMASGSLSTTLSVALKKAREEEKSFFYNIQLENQNKIQNINLTVAPFQTVSVERDLLIVSFEEADECLEVVETEESQVNERMYQQRIEDLEQELDFTRENLQATIEELEASNEELQATNEELMASNEELQSTNEELESVNEELITVNSEHQSKIEELRKLNNDIDNLLQSTNIGTIFLDDDLKIRKFTPAIKDIINIRKRDEGRPLQDISHDIQYNNLLADCRNVIDNLVPVEKEVKTTEGKWYLMRILPYRTKNNLIKGVVITLIKIDELKKSNQELEKLTYVVEESPFIIVITDIEGDIKYVNQAFTRYTGYQTREVRGKNVNILKSGYTPDSNYQKLWETIENGRKWEGEFYNKNKQGELYWEWATIYPVLDQEGEIVNYVKMANAIEDLQELEDKLSQLDT